MLAVRILAVIFCLLVVGGLLGIYLSRPSAVTSNPRGLSLGMSNASCRDCHRQVWDEWESSRHALTWTSPQVQAAFQHFGHDRKCQSCHAPTPVLVTGWDQEVALRAEDRDSGVNCLTCHSRGDGAIAAARDVASAPCHPKKTDELTSSRSCGVCHDAIYKDWTATEFASQGKTCQDCHMRRDGTTAHRSHVCRGGYDTELVRSAVVLECEQRERELWVRLTNREAGHNFPGERHNRVLVLEVVESAADGEIALAQQALIKGVTPFRGESSAERLKHGESYELTFPVVPPAETARVRLLYKLFPWMSDDDATVLIEREVTVR